MHPTFAGAEGEAPSAVLFGTGACAVGSGAAASCLLSSGIGTGCSAASAMAGLFPGSGRPLLCTKPLAARVDITFKTYL